MAQQAQPCVLCQALLWVPAQVLVPPSHLPPADGLGGQQRLLAQLSTALPFRATGGVSKQVEILKTKEGWQEGRKPKQHTAERAPSQDSQAAPRSPRPSRHAAPISRACTITTRDAQLQLWTEALPPALHGSPRICPCSQQG